MQHRYDGAGTLSLLCIRLSGMICWYGSLRLQMIMMPISIWHAWIVCILVDVFFDWHIPKDTVQPSHCKDCIWEDFLPSNMVVDWTWKQRVNKLLSINSRSSNRLIP